MQINLIKCHDGAYRPADEDTQRRLQTVKVGSWIIANYTPNRNWLNHRRWFAFRDVTFDMQDQYEDKEVWRGVLQIYGGHCKTVVDRKGDTNIWPESISYEVMDDEIKFNEMFDRSLNCFLKYYAPSMSEEQFFKVLEFD